MTERSCLTAFLEELRKKLGEGEIQKMDQTHAVFLVENIVLDDTKRIC